MANSNNETGFVIFGKDVTKIPCFRNSFLYGIGGGFVGGLVTFLFTSRVKRSTDLGVGVFAVVTLAYWAQCRYKYSNTRYDMLKVQELLKRKTMYEGTEHDTNIESSLEMKTEEV